METFRTWCPVALRTTERFVQTVDIAGERKRIEFGKPVVWLQHSQTRFEYRHGGLILKEGDLQSDRDGYLDSCEFRAPGPREMAAQFGINPDSSLELVVRATVFLLPALETPMAGDYRKVSNLAKTQMIFARIPQNWMLETLIDGVVVSHPIGRRDLVSEIIWCSRNLPEENARIAAEFKARWRVRPEGVDSGRVAA